MKLSDALRFESEIRKVTEALNKSIQAAAIHGVEVDIDTVGFQHVGGRQFMIVATVCKVNLSHLEAE